LAHGTIGNDRVRIEVNEPGVHPFLSVLLPAPTGGWSPAVLLGARQQRYFHTGAAFPRMICDGQEADTGSLARVEPDADGLGVLISDTRAGFTVESRIKLEPDSPVVHVVHKLTPTADTSFNRVFDRFDFIEAQGDEASALDYSYVPHLRPRSEMVISDAVFRSPVVMMSKGGVFFAVVPDLDVLHEAYSTGSARYYLDYLTSAGENMSPTVSFGAGHSRVKGHVYFESDFQRETELAEGVPLNLAYHLIVDRDGFGAADAVDFIWKRYGRRHYEAGEPQTAGWDRYASAGLARIFKRADLFKTFSLEGQACGGTIGIHFMTRKGVRTMSFRELQRYLRYQEIVLGVSRKGIEKMSEHQWLEPTYERASYRFGPKAPPQVFLQSWFNNLRSAYGAYWFGRRWNDHELLEHSQRVKNLAILAPREGGAFPSVCYPTEAGVFWSRGTRGFKHVDWYHTADCATTGYYMAEWFRDHEGDPRLVARCRELASFLMDVQLPSGAIPAWVQPVGSTKKISADLKESATTAAPAMFLAQLYSIHSDVAYLEAALKACDFLAREVIPSQKWFDYETFYSCSKKRLGLFDENTGTYPQNAMSMFWAAEAMLLVYQATLEDEYLELGEQVLNHACLLQQAWDPPFLSINAFGGFGSMNTDAEWNDARQGLAAPLLMDYYRATGKDIYMERGISALRASFTLMFIDENRPVAPGNMRIAIPEETCSIAENYAHFGYDHAIPGFLDSDWGAGSACHAAAYAQKHYGDIFVDVARMKAFGINGCRVDGITEENGLISLEVVSHIDAGTEVMVRLAGEAGHRLEVNRAPAKRTGAGEFSVLL